MNNDRYGEGFYGYDGYDDHTEIEPVKPKFKDELVIKVIETLQISKDEVLLIKYPADTPYDQVNSFSKAFTQHINYVMGEEVGNRIMFVPDNLNLSKVKLEKDPETHPLYPAVKASDNYDGDMD